MSDDAKRIFDKLLSGKDPIEYMWQNVETMREEATPTPNAHGREDMPQTDKVDGEFISPRAEEVSESTKISESSKRKTTMKKLNITKERFEKSNYFKRKYGKLEYVSESGKLFKTNKGKVLMFKEGFFFFFLDALDDGIRGVKKFFHKAKFKKGDKIMVCMGDFSPPGVQHGLEVIDTQYGGWSGGWEYRTGTDDWGNPEWWPELRVALDTDPDGGYEEYDPAKFPEFKKLEKYMKKKDSRKLAKESSGEVASPDNVQVDDILYCTSYYDFMISTFYKVLEKRGKSTLVLQRLKKNYAGSQSDGVAEPTDEIDPDCKPITVRYGKRGFKIGSNRLYVWDGTPLEEYNYSESRKFGKEIEGADPALICPYCGGDNCEISIGTDDLNFTNLDRLDGETFNVECWCNDCDKPYNVTVELNVKDVYPNEDADGLSGDWA